VGPFMYVLRRLRAGISPEPPLANALERDEIGLNRIRIPESGLF
jgi:hypothetical protein